MNKPVIFKTKYFTFAIFLLLFSTFVNAQTENPQITQKQKSDFWDNVRYGGGIGLNFGSGFTNLTLAPSAIYSFSKQFAMGPAINFNYSNRKNDFDATVIGASILSLYQPIDQIQLSVEFEENNVNFKDKINDSSLNYWYSALYIGGGYNISDFGAIGVRYDVLYNDEKSIYGSALMPFVRVYF
ncbi:alpha-ketoglutarate decarboxylase [Pseudofulvibacter geojedonensis]|uniref:Alpha-ketoglutarate decarboxylase n=1 Tax=Pseudofulvibacter geojedonensis TaxID=1123758 RepID=A0ABW3I5M2_9FLAO